MKKLLLTAFAASLLLSSCNQTFYQVYQTESPGLSELNNTLVYENEDCKIMYDLWCEDGNPGFVMHNKTDKDLYVMMPQTFFIKNDIAFDYFQNREYESTQSTSSSLGVNLWGSWSNASAKSVAGTSTAVVHKESPIVCIPPHTSKRFFEFDLLRNLIRNCNKYQAYPKTRSIPIEFSKDDSPLNFKNRITYSFDKCGDVSKSIENEFWISELINYTAKEAGSFKMMKECDGDEAVRVYRFDVSAPGKFYNSYKGFSMGKNKSDSKGELIYFD